MYKIYGNQSCHIFLCCHTCSVWPPHCGVRGGLPPTETVRVLFPSKLGPRHLQTRPRHSTSQKMILFDLNVIKSFFTFQIRNHFNTSPNIAASPDKDNDKDQKTPNLSKNILISWYIYDAFSCLYSVTGQILLFADILYHTTHFMQSVT